MNINERLLEIWSQDYINTLPALIKDRGFDYSENDKQKDILITGFNPSFDPKETESKSTNFNNILNTEKPDTHYWYPIRKMLFDEESNIDLRPNAAYLDLFYFREQEQTFLTKHILKNKNGIPFVVDQMNLTQHIIEDVIKPKLIIVKNKESWAYWGKLANEGFIWMGYQFEFIQNMTCGELFKITGLIDSLERISPEFTKTNLENSYVLFTQYINQYTPAEKRPTALAVKAILDCCYAKENLSKMKI